MHMLEARLSSEAFTAFLRGWFSSKAFTAVVTNDFLNALKTAFPDRSAELDRFFNEFVYSVGHPTLSLDMHGNTVTIVQTQAQPFAFPIELELADGSTTVVQVSEQTTTVTLPAAITAIDPNTRLLHTVICDSAHPCLNGAACSTKESITSQSVCEL